jgi:hypothetical protein
MKSAHVAGLLVGFAILGCDSVERGRPALGDATELIVAMADSLWAETGDSLIAAVAPRTFSVRNERTFTITQVSPASELWLDTKQFKQVIAVGVPGDFWMTEALDGTAQAGTPPDIVTVDNVWARGQSVVAVVLPAENPAQALQSLLPEIGELMDGRFRQYARSRMFLSDTNVALRDSLAANAGFSITLPRIYRSAAPGENLRAFHNRNEVGGDLFRTIIVSWVDEVIEDADSARVLAWRDSILPAVYDEPQVTQRERVDVRPLPDRAPGSVEVQGVWAGTDPTFPTGGPFVDRIVVCPDQERTYFLEAWMYGPSREKYEYLIQFQTILDSFRCGG